MKKCLELLFKTFIFQQEAAYIINVHHITKYGDNGGTFYFDTRTKELDGEYVTYTELMKAMYPENCGYSSIVQGIKNV